ncbi:MAG TPA: tetratricopeptide repeat protein [Candidatus Krumholzibacteria bacterium]|nr:tetratricopeptide repeat protein [Candidatus Krumholzibacteria bacterium]HPD71494.1 tetratricopeptide repeat protein [Candidatus Krumholzibacteria bacterium]HRY41573.1 tetratricopeptide repeat protein [Candidatus Krumholzibacteria bacterium]
MAFLRRRSWFIAIIALAAGVAASTPDDLPLPSDQVMNLPDNPGEDIGLPLGATSAYAIGRSLQQQGETEASLVYLNRAYQLAPGSPRIATAFAQSLVEAGFVADAARIYRDLVAAAPDSIAQRRQYALLLAQAGRPQASLEQVEELHRRGEADPGLVKLQADLLEELDRVDDAIRVYEEASRRDPERTEEYTLAAGALLQQHGRFAEMAERLQAGLRSEPTSRPMRVALIRYLVHAGDLTAARAEAASGDDARRAGGITDRPECTLELADQLARSGDFANAAAVLQAVHDSGLRDRGAEAQLARYLLGLGQVEAALALLPDAAGRWPQDGELRYLWGRAAELQDDPEGALLHLREATEREPTLATYRIALLRLLVLHEREALAADSPTPGQEILQREARDHAREAALTVNPQDAEGHLILGYVYRALGDLEEACRHYRLAGEVAEHRVAALLEVGFCLHDAGRNDEARQVLVDLQAEFPDDPEVANSCGYFLAEIGEDLAKAETMIRQALRTDPENGAYLDSLGWVLYKRGEFAQAFDWLVAATNQRPEDPVILEHLGLALRELGRRAEALDVLRRALANGGDAPRLTAFIEELERVR